MNINLIWDADGTLIDSYDSIVATIIETLKHYNIDKYESSFIRDYIQKTTVSSFLNYAADNDNLNGEELVEYHAGVMNDNTLIKLMPNARDVLCELNKNGVNNFIYTHRRNTIYTIVKNLNVDKDFIEIVSYENGFKLKPAPDGVDYLVNKYHMDKNNTYYIGDRLLDQQCAKNAGIKAIFYESYKGLNIDPSEYDIKIDDLYELLNLLK